MMVICPDGGFLHEIGLAISHSSYHKHSAYLLEYSDIPGFSQVDQKRMAQLMLNHRRKLKADMLEQTLNIGGDQLVYLCLLLRLAVLAHHSRSDQELPELQLEIIEDNCWQITVANDSEHYAFFCCLTFILKLINFAKWGVKLSIVAA